MKILCFLMMAGILLAVTACSAAGEEGNISEGRYVETDITPPIAGQFMSLMTHDGTIVAFDNGLRTRFDSTDGGASWTQSPGPGSGTNHFENVTAASFLGEVGDPLRFQNARQIARYAGYNLVEDSSGQSKSGTIISKRGRKQLRSILYQMAFTMVGNNAEMKALYQHLTTREKNPLKKKQALVVVSKKIITVIYSLLKKQESYKPELVLGAVRKEMMRAA